MVTIAISAREQIHSLALDAIARAAMEEAGLSPADGWMLDISTRAFVRTVAIPDDDQLDAAAVDSPAIARPPAVVMATVRRGDVVVDLMSDGTEIARADPQPVDLTPAKPEAVDPIDDAGAADGGA